MPFAVDLCSRNLYEMSFADHGDDEWTRAKVVFERLVSDQHPHVIEWETCTTIGYTRGDVIIVHDYDTAFDIEYYTRGGGSLKVEVPVQHHHHRELVYYGDVVTGEISDEQYILNVMHQDRFNICVQ